MRTLLRGHAATVLVAALSAAFGVVLLGTVEVLTLAANANPVVGDLGSAGIMLAILAYVFMAIAIYVAAIVTTNTVATIVAGRIREIALVRLLGASARGERVRVAREGLTAGVVGAAIGTAAAWLLLGALVLWGEGAGLLPSGVTYAFVTPQMAIPVAAVVLTTWLAAWVGSRRVLSVTPVQALGAAVPSAAEGLRRGRRGAAWAIEAVGVALLLLGAAAGQITPLGVLIGIVGGICSFTGIMIGAPLLIPPVLAVVGRLFGRDPAAVLGTRNTLRHPERSARAAIGLVIGVALVTMFVVAGMTANEIVNRRMAAQWGTTAPLDSTLGTMMSILAFLVGFSGVIAAVGLVNTLTVGVLQRTREFGLVRALGLSRSQLRRTISVEAVQLAVTAVVVGFVLGIVYGWLGAQSMFGSSQIAGLVPPVVPWVLVLGVVVVAGVLALAGSLIPARRAIRLVPVEALAVE